MKKLLTLAAAAAMTVAGAFAQESKRTVHGFVIDNNGNPIAGAEVTATGGGASAISDADGSFTMQVSPFLKTLTATYSVMASNKIKVDFNSDIIIALKEQWRTRAFANAIGNICVNSYANGGGGGVMGGVIGKWGGYGKVTVDNNASITATAGVIKGITPKIYAFVGVGFGSAYWEYWSHYSYYNGYSYQFEDLSESGHDVGFAIEFGGILKLSKHFNLMIGYTPVFVPDDESSHNINIGCGYVF